MIVCPVTAMKITKWTLTITVITWPPHHFLSGMPGWMNMTPEDINLAVESLPNPSEGHILPGISLQAIEVK
jgi:hypothetical protein